ncbi:MAG: hypothetical protein BZY82_07345 [SAR202 cluster bacterium Io17-Chloro-G3]|nr:MAG: hypothetical protein BZY82_07345 [SAR202 cluster bacterium Io17-Chloro-G3]
MPRFIKTSITDPIEISEIDCPRGKIGITLCPGKKGSSSFGGTWDRDIETDISAIEQQFEPALILTLMTDSELSASGVHGLGEAFLDKGIQWIQLQISELSLSDESSIQLWSSIPYVLSLLMEGCNVLIHDRGGLGRAACLAAVLLIELGVSNSDAINTVRRSRPGAIETKAQEQFVLNYVPHNLPHFFCHGCVQNMIRLWGHIISSFNHLLLKPEGSIGAFELNVYRAFVQDFRHYMCGIGAQIDKLTKNLQLSLLVGAIDATTNQVLSWEERLSPSTAKRFPVNLHRWKRTYPSEGSMGAYQPPDEPKLLVDWWRSISLPIVHSRFVDNKFGKQIKAETVTIPWGQTKVEIDRDGNEATTISDGVQRKTIQWYVEAQGCLDDKAPRRLMIDWNQISKNQIYESMYSIQKYFDDYYQRFNQMMVVHHELLTRNSLPHQDLLWPRANQHHLERGCEFPKFPSGNRGDSR